MKRFLKFAVLPVLAVCMLFAISACSNAALKEVAGTYEMSSVSGTINNTTVSTDMYEYFRIILDDKGNGTVQSKGKGVGSVAYEQKGTYTYSDGKIKMTTKNGGASVTEEYDYADGVITYNVNTTGMNFKIVFNKVVEE